MLQHKPVLLSEVLNVFGYLWSPKDSYFVDGTLGAGGHSIAITQMQSGKLKFKIIGIDKDAEALALAKRNIADISLTGRFIFIHDDFRNIRLILNNLEINKIDGALLDLGISSMQIDQPERGFSFQNPEAPLDMRMDQSQKLTAETILNSWPQGELEKIFRDIGQEKYARQIAKAAGQVRKMKPIKTVGDLLEVLTMVMPPKARFDRNKHYATNVFRALRISVNNELGQLEKAISDFASCLKPGAKLAIITFHSTEDRIVKNIFKNLANPCVCPPDLPECVCGKKSLVGIVTKKPIIPTQAEITKNPRARSAKLRVAERL